MTEESKKEPKLKKRYSTKVVKKSDKVSIDLGNGKRAYALKDRQEDFIKYYLECFSERKAAELAGYNDYQGHELMKNPLIRDRINMGITAMFHKYGIKEDLILEELRTIAFSKDPLTVGIKYSDKLNALKLLGTQMGMFKERDDEKTINPPSITVIVDKEVKAPEIIIDEIKPNTSPGRMVQ
jgi:hypothetical protein